MTDIGKKSNGATKNIIIASLTSLLIASVAYKIGESSGVSQVKVLGEKIQAQEVVVAKLATQLDNIENTLTRISIEGNTRHERIMMILDRIETRP